MIERVLFLVFVWVIGGAAIPPSVEYSRVVFAETAVLGQQIEFAIWETKFDQEVYYIHGLGCKYRKECDELKEFESYCDYASKEECGRCYSTTPLNCTCPKKDYYCSLSSDWLEVQVEHSIDKDDDKIAIPYNVHLPHHFRFFINPEVHPPCAVPLIDMAREQYFAFFTVEYDRMLPVVEVPRGKSFHQSGALPYQFCPEQNRQRNLNLWGTYFIRLRVFQGSSSAFFPEVWLSDLPSSQPNANAAPAPEFGVVGLSDGDEVRVAGVPNGVMYTAASIIGGTCPQSGTHYYRPVGDDNNHPGPFCWLAWSWDPTNPSQANDIAVGNLYPYLAADYYCSSHAQFTRLFCRLDGETTYQFTLSVSTVVDVAGNPDYIIGFHTDIDNEICSARKSGCS
eukprot:CAMPEP_0174275152 /NCGR_PEP_ID=MMETSP0439-20130205/59672_1 /TAXON_ID=0 /ORGANISM="Stereomyxa ramosa, Strain Chinc5" /LENGTH=394 /DNA_ID=CAMNT_0015367233 /DNA_START=12 /DNA_END=1196 /DNA_ORIENTATION=+